MLSHGNEKENKEAEAQWFTPTSQPYQDSD